MKRKFFSVMAVFMAAIFVLSAVPVSAALSHERVNKDYRNMQIVNKQGGAVNKPTAQFAAKRVVNGEIVDAVISYKDYDCTTEFPTLVCYAGDTLTFEDLSHDNNQGGKIVEWDWQYYGSIGEHNKIYKSNVLDSTSFVLNNPGETFFYLCVKNNANIKKGSCDPWSENGNHQIVGRNNWFPKGIYWYFSAIRVVVKPMREAAVNVRYWDAHNNMIFKEERVSVGQFSNTEDVIETCINITDQDGYLFSGWDVRLEDGTTQYSGTERDVFVSLSGWLPQKYLDIEFYPYMPTSVDVRYWNSAENSIICTEKLMGDMVAKDMETTVTPIIMPPERYEITGWNVQLVDGTIQHTGEEIPVSVTLSGYIPEKYLNVECKKMSNTELTVKYVDSDTKEILTSEIIAGEEVHGSETTDITVDIKDIPGYVIMGWKVILPDGSIEDSGIRDTVRISFTEAEAQKILEVDCLRLSHDDDVDEGDDNLPDPEIIIKPSGECNGIIEWTEIDSHRVFVKYDKKKKPVYRTCIHSFDYISTLTADAVIEPDTFKSGYGFGVDVNCSVSTNLESNTGGCSSWGENRSSLMSVRIPTKSTVYIPWDMSNRLGTQSKAIEMESNGILSFRLPVSNVSETGARKIYTPVELSGTEEEPAMHEFEIYVSGGGLEGVEFCQKIICKITINGDMYSDDFSGSD